MEEKPKLKIEFDESIGNTPAALDRNTGTIYINKSLYNKFTPFQRRFVLLHEMGHYYFDTHSELYADAYAFMALAGSEYQSLKKCYETLLATLEKDNATRAERLRNMKQLIYYWDYTHGNEEAGTELLRLMEMEAYGSVTIFPGWTIEWDTAAEQKTLQEAAILEQQANEMASTTKLKEQAAEYAMNQETAGKVAEYIIIIVMVAAIGYLLFTD